MLLLPVNLASRPRQGKARRAACPGRDLPPISSPPATPLPKIAASRSLAGSRGLQPRGSCNCSHSGTLASPRGLQSWHSQEPGSVCKLRPSCRPLCSLPAKTATQPWVPGWLQGRACCCRRDRRERTGDRERAVLVKNAVDVLRWECGDSGELKASLVNLAVLQNSTEQSILSWGRGARFLINLFILLTYFILFCFVFWQTDLLPAGRRNTQPPRANP